MIARRDAHSLGSMVVSLALILSALPATVVAEPRPRRVPVTINAGETYVIRHLDSEGTPSVRVVRNPDALLLHADKPGELVLLGAARGEWIIDATSDQGEPLSYDVTVKAIANPFRNPLAPGNASAAIGHDHATAAASAALDPGSGPVAMATAAPSAAAPATAAPAPIRQTAEALDQSSADAKPAIRDPAQLAVAPAPSASKQPPLAVEDAPDRVISSQSVPTAPTAAPQKFRSNPLAVLPRSTGAVTGGTHPLPADGVVLMSGTSKIFDFPQRLRRVSIADTDIADLQVINPYQINLVGHHPGFTTLAIWDAQGNYVERQVRVDRHGKAQVMLNVIVAELDRSRIEQQGINWSAALPNYNVSLVGLGPGGVATPYTAASSLTSSILLGAGTPQQTVLSTSAAGTLPPGGQVIPLLLSPTLNYGLAAQNSNVATQTFFNFLENHNLGKILAEPHLLANSGEKAEFLSGGEIPIVVAQALNTSIVFKQFGTSVIFVPTVVGSDDIELEVRPEVSQPDYAHAVSLFGFSVPAFVTRRAKTFVRLRNNQTFIIAGLILHTPVSQVDKTPYLGDLPYFGGLFRHTQYSDENTDLVIAVTPQIVRPLPVNGEALLPTERGPLTGEEIRTQRLFEPDASRPRF